MNGYRQMIRDRMPLTLDLALKWCKAKERWISYVYDTIVSKYPKQSRSAVVKRILGLKKSVTRQEIYDHYRYVKLDKSITPEKVNAIPVEELYLKFSDTIDYDTLYKEDADMYDYWKAVESWVDWFKQNYQYIENEYSVLKTKGTKHEDIVERICEIYSLPKKLSNYIIKSF